MPEGSGEECGIDISVIYLCEVVLSDPQIGETTGDVRGTRQVERQYLKLNTSIWGLYSVKDGPLP